MLLGADTTLRAHRPALYLEHNEVTPPPARRAVLAALRALEYRCWHHRFPTELSGGAYVESNIVCLHEGAAAAAGPLAALLAEMPETDMGA